MTTYVVTLASDDKIKMSEKAFHALYDKSFFLAVLCIQLFGFIMVFSSSLSAADSIYGNSFHFVFRHAAYLIIAWSVALLFLSVDSLTWKKLSPYLLLASLFMLFAVLIVGHEVNGSRRWLNFGLFTVQVTEVVKIFFIMYLAGYLVRRQEELQRELKGFIKPLIVVSLIVGLTLMEPDFGAAVVIVATCLVMMFLAGAKLWQFLVLSLSVSAALAMVAVTQEYRLRRLQSFLDPWSDPFGSGYQLTQSLIAFGRGDWFGQGLGNSLQKLSYLPEAHTDFVMAIIAEELGFVGVFLVVALFLFLFCKVFLIGRQSAKFGNYFSAYLAYGIGVWLSIQTLINIGVNSGVLPTKGITLPLLSYGGNSLIVCTAALAIALRIDYENRLIKIREKRGEES